MWVILVGNVFGGRCGAEALGLGLMSLNPAYRFALPPGLAAKTTRCLAFDQGRLPAIFIIRSRMRHSFFFSPHFCYLFILLSAAQAITYNAHLTLTFYFIIKRRFCILASLAHAPDISYLPAPRVFAQSNQLTL